MEFLRSFVRNHFAWKPVVVSRNVGFSLKLLLNISFTTWASDGYHALMVHCSDSLLAEVSHGQRRRRWDRETSRGLHTFFYHASTCVPLRTGDVSVTCDTTCRTGFRDNNFHQGTHIQFENQEVSTTNVVGGYMKGCVGGRQRSFSFLSFFACRKRPLLAENGSG